MNPFFRRFRFFKIKLASLAIMQIDKIILVIFQTVSDFTVWLMMFLFE